MLSVVELPPVACQTEGMSGMMRLQLDYIVSIKTLNGFIHNIQQKSGLVQTAFQKYYHLFY